MGPVQVLREAVAIAIAAALGLAVTGQAAAQPARSGASGASGPSGTPVAIVDARPGGGDRAALDADRERFAAELDRVLGVSVVADPELRAALAGRALERDDRDAREALAEARDGFGALACGRARPAAEDAVRALAGREAAGVDERVRLRAAWTYVLLCAERDGDDAVARGAADRLRDLGGGAGVPAATWDRYPEIDATAHRDVVELTVAAPVGAEVWIDHAPAGVAPVSRYVVAGKHVVAVAAGAVRGATLVTALGQPLSIDVEASDQRGDREELAATVRRWQGGGGPTVADMTALLEQLGVRFAVVLDRGGRAALWVRGPTETAARLAVDAEHADPVEVGNAIVTRAIAWSEGGPDPDLPLLTESDVPDRRTPSREPTRWWVYAVVGGALAAGAITIFALETGQDHQRIELDFP